MERMINEDLNKWRRDSINKPFFLYGPRQVGKTWSVLEFGRRFYKNIAYFNTDNNIELYNILDKEKVLDKLIVKISVLCGETIFAEDTLIVFDNVNDPEMMNLLKVFGKVNSPYKVIMISSNKVEINKLRIEEFYYRGMTNMDFFEYLSNTDRVQLIDFIKDSFDNDTVMPFHQMALESYNEYLVTGGFPEVVKAKLDGKTALEIEAIKKKILDIYQGEYFTYHDSIRCDEVMNVLPCLLVKENKKFQYGSIKKGARSKEYEEGISNLVTNGIVNRSWRLQDVKSPLMSAKDQESFKLYFNDVGLLYTALHLNNSRFTMDKDIRRSLVENDVANTLIKLGHTLYYYQSDGKSEINFVLQNKVGKIVPLEVVDMKLTKAKAMSLFLNKFKLHDCIRITEDNFSKKKGVKLIPVYATCCLKNL